MEKDLLIWQRIKKGDSEAYSIIYDQYVDVLISIGQYYSSDKEFIISCIHDLFFDIYKYRKNLSDNDNIKLYLIKSLKRKIVKELQRNKTIKLVDDFKVIKMVQAMLKTQLLLKREKDILKKL